MSHNNETQYEEAVRKGELVPDRIMQYHIDSFNQGGGERPVKVMPTEAQDQDHVSGFFTQEKYIKGHTPKEMEYLLGLKPGTLENGATIYELSETPKADQFVPAGYTHMPGGRPYEEGGEYPVGPGVKQFKLKEDVPANVIGRVGYEEPWTGQCPQQEEAPPASNTEAEQTDEYSQGYGY